MNVLRGGNRNRRAHLRRVVRHACCCTSCIQPALTMKMRRANSAQRPRRAVPAPQPDLPLPHERDQSSEQPPARRTRVLKTAHQDVEQGRVDTDQRGVEALRAFNDAARNPSTDKDRKRKRTRP
jgi:hypothetical protein